MNKMFCFQCEQTAKGEGCTIQGVCGKTFDTANLQDELTNKTIEFANCVDYSKDNTELIVNALFTTITNVNFDNESIKNLINELSEKNTCKNHFDIKEVWECNEDIRSLK